MMKNLAPMMLAALVMAACAPFDGSGASPVTTDRSTYTLERSDGHLHAEVGLTIENVTDRTISLLNCRGAFALVLEQQVGNEWVPAWQPALPMCLSEPIVIAPGESHRTTLAVMGGAPGSNVHPQFETDDPAGTYRVVITSAYWDYSPDGPPWGEEPPLEYRTSAPFELEVGQ